MLRRFVNWLKYTFRLKKREKKPAVESLLELVPLVMAACIVIGAIRWLAPELKEGPQPSLWSKLIRRVKHIFWLLRIKLIGY